MNTHFQRTWLAAVALFLLAASTGALYRFGILYGAPWGLALGNVRHAHSHLMFLGWATPALFSLIAHWWPLVTGRPWRKPHLLAGLIWLTLALALTSYVPFLLFGYGMAPLGTAKLPLASMVLGVAMFGWYAFIAQYIWESWGAPRPLPVQLWDAALAFMVLSSLGAWGVAATARLDMAPFWSAATTQLFLITFTEGWFLVGTLGVLFAALPATQTAVHSRTYLAALAIGVPFLFLLNVPLSMVPAGARGLAAVGGLSAVIGLVGLGWVLWRVAPSAVRWPLGFLALKAGGMALLILPSTARWLAGAGLYISVLHWLLLGFVTLALVWVAHQSWPRPSAAPTYRWLVAAVVLLLLTLIPLTGLWPGAWLGRWAVIAVAWGTIPPLVVMGMEAFAAKGV
jgi:hypothetical protein